MIRRKASRMAVSRTENRIEPRHPSRLEKKKNIPGHTRSEPDGSDGELNAHATKALPHPTQGQACHTGVTPGVTKRLPSTAPSPLAPFLRAATLAIVTD